MTADYGNINADNKEDRYGTRKIEVVVDAGDTTAYVDVRNMNHKVQQMCLQVPSLDDGADTAYLIIKDGELFELYNGSASPTASLNREILISDNDLLLVGDMQFHIILSDAQPVDETLEIVLYFE